MTLPPAPRPPDMIVESGVGRQISSVRRSQNESCRIDLRPAYAAGEGGRVSDRLLLALDLDQA